MSGDVDIVTPVSQGAGLIVGLGVAAVTLKALDRLVQMPKKSKRRKKNSIYFS